MQLVLECPGGANVPEVSSGARHATSRQLAKSEVTCVLNAIACWPSVLWL